jgi:periplasmic protein TonB
LTSLAHERPPGARAAELWQDWAPLSSVGVIFALLISFGIHLSLYLFLIAHARSAPPKKVEEISLEVHTVERPRPPPPPPEVAPSRKIERAVARIVKPPPRALPPPPNQTPPPSPPPQAPPPIRIGVNLESTVPGGEFAAPVGNTMYGEAPPRAPAPAAVKPYWAASYVPQSRVNELPVLLDEVKAPYPPAARKEGIEGQVVLMLTIDSEGKVAEVKKISGPGHGLDEAAAKAASQFRWKPARSNGAAVSTIIRYVYSFEID